MLESIFSGSVLTVVTVLSAVAFYLLIRIALAEILPQLRSGNQTSDQKIADQ